MNILFRDAGRFFGFGGYSELSRGLMYGFMLSGSKVIVEDSIFSKIPNNYAVLKQKIFRESDVNSIDYSVTITNINAIPNPRRGVHKNLLITGSPFLGLTDSIKSSIGRYDAISYSGDVDKINFSQYNAFDIPQPVKFFKRCQLDSDLGSQDLRKCQLEFLFVGTFNFWKGVDLAIHSFLLAELDADSRLTLKCPIFDHNDQSIEVEIKRAKHYELFVSMISKYIYSLDLKSLIRVQSIDKKHIELMVSDGNQAAVKFIHLDIEVSDDVGMLALYSRTDFLLHLSRGETWSMPVAEALSLGLRVLIPQHYGITKYVLGQDGVHVFNAKQKAFDEFDFSSDRSSGGGRAYLNFGIKYFEVNPIDVANSIKDISRELPIDKLSMMETLHKFNPIEISKSYFLAFDAI